MEAVADGEVYGAESALQADQGAVKEVGDLRGFGVREVKLVAKQADRVALEVVTQRVPVAYELQDVVASRDVERSPRRR